MCVYEFPRPYAGRPKAVKTTCLSPSTEIAISDEKDRHGIFMNVGSTYNKPVNQEKGTSRKRKVKMSQDIFSFRKNKCRSVYLFAFFA
jgi:hypothetical protein